MTVLNRPIMALAICVASLVQLSDLSAEDRLSSSVQIEFPIGDVAIHYVESAEGMVLIAKSGHVSVQARRLHFGDGKRAVTYAATNEGLQTPVGRVNAAALQIKDGTLITVPLAKLKRWARRSGEVYILVPNLKLEAQKD